MKNIYTRPEMEISVFGTENVAAAASNPNAQQIKDDWKDFASIAETRFVDLKYVQ